MGMKKESLRGLSGIVVRLVVLGAVATAAGKELREDYSGSQSTIDPILKINPASALPSEQALKEQAVDPRNISAAIALLENSGNEKIVAEAGGLRELYIRGVIYLTREQKPEENNLGVPVGRFASTWVEWDQIVNEGLRIAVPEQFAADPQVGEADLAFFILFNARFARSLDGSTTITISDIQERVDLAWRRTLTDTLPILGKRIRHPVLRDAFSRHLAASRFSPEFSAGTK